ncbi:serine protease [Pseudorhodobacter sp. W20_MBD10_FR17]|uniref:trypsin-like serine peptidase n=1 Tax=Pseudorhodobacter sp. W20_MBD10_FR17 TaxID=3240266 RepID=UPI003F9B2E45
MRCTDVWGQTLRCRFAQSIGVLVLALPIWFSAAPVAAQSGALPEIARVSSAGFKTRGHCTGFADSDGNLITSAHCLPRFKKDSLHFLFGYDRGDYQTHIQARAAEFVTNPAMDIAFGCGLAVGVPGIIVAQAETMAGRNVVLMGYGIPKSQVLQQRNCTIEGPVQAGFLALDCPQAPGGSGSPVLIWQGGEWRVAGVVSATRKTRSKATYIADSASDLCGKPDR